MSAVGNALPLPAERSEQSSGYERIPDPSERTPERYDSLGRRWVPRVFVRMTEPPGAWAVDGLCREVGGDLWFPDNGSNGNQAKAICRECPVMNECLEWAIRNGETEGIWGGLSAHQRAKLRRKGNAA